jgi:hypothetical protein
MKTPLIGIRGYCMRCQAHVYKQVSPLLLLVFIYILVRHPIKDYSHRGSGCIVSRGYRQKNLLRALAALV